jgi:serine/threonine protein kinase
MLKSRPPNDWWVKIADFGISKRVEDELGVSTTLKGTLGFIAPELHGFTERDTDYASDLWALGEISFQMLTKQPTFKNLALLFAYTQNPKTFPLPALRAHNVSESVVDFILAAMKPLPNMRITTESALRHNWMKQFICETRPLTSPPSEINTHLAIDSLSEEFAASSTVPSSQQTTIKPTSPIAEGKFKPLEGMILDHAYK